MARENFTLRLDPRGRDYLRSVADKHGVTLTDVLRVAVRLGTQDEKALVAAIKDKQF